MLTTFPIEFSVPEGTLEDVEAEFDCTAETYPAEPYSWGEGRGHEVEINACLFSVRLGDLKLDRNQLCLMIGNPAVDKIEDWICEAKRDEITEAEA